MSASPEPDPKKRPKGQALKQPKLELPPDLEAVYVNLVRIAHTPSEMVFDFARLLPGDTGVSVLARILMSPLSAKLFHRALTENLAKYEATYGAITIPSKPSGLADFLFRSTQSPPDEPPEPSSGE
jgi:hypothetical protein